MQKITSQKEATFSAYVEIVFVCSLVGIISKSLEQKLFFPKGMLFDAAHNITMPLIKTFYKHLNSHKPWQ
jgi:hypothetical protein